MLAAIVNPGYIIGFLTNMVIFALLGLSLNIIIGYIGYLNLGHVGFWAIGAYTYTLLLMNGTNYFVALLAGGVAAGISGLLLGIPTLKLKSHYIAIASLGFTYIVYSLVINLNDLTRGPLGIPGIPRPVIFGIDFSGDLAYLILSIIIVSISCLIIYILLRSPWGRILETIREDEIASKSLGKNIFKYKIQAFILSAFFAGIAGGIFASFHEYIGGPGAFFLPQLLFILSVVMMGGAGSFWGSIVGAAALMTMYEAVRFLPIEATLVGPTQQASFALVLILIMIIHPRGIMGRKIKTFQK
ncbi:branched-chain amino acid ABC transporter permease [Patescibacteria group bacterium]|nr:branched-chain amino acid ABC transporter permease [Patescibacteria group bacterium]MBU1703324.1 branched-chain amino acid ABC transporter permease [Patescibacteria group bacterium]MBU1953854.1 branched-chain amino acid ABC transporter permease [Patescibacteria group bacterium]